ncbi:MAG: nucleoside-diphosphate-sugar pyrophosphorylase [Phycisphaerae bacterium]|nr:MAG: nucleoside-diphosphate-sugar pyrophosphorylase [Phycisphaerae bacterium]
MNDCVVILAGGQGSRLRPYTTVLPKPLMPVGDVPILELLVKQLRSLGLKRLIFATNYRDGLLRSYFGTGKSLGVDITYCKENRPMGTVGPLHLVADELPQSFLVMNGDILTDLNYRTLLENHKQSGELLTLGTFRKKLKIGDGVLDIDAAGCVSAFREKPTIPLTISLGAYAMDRDVLDLIPAGVPFGMDELVLTMLERNMTVNSYRHDGMWLDIGTPSDLERANELFASKRKSFLGIDPATLLQPKQESPEEARPAQGVGA